MIFIEGGTFNMGNPKTTERNSNEGPVHSVPLSGFYMGKYEVTREQYQAVMGENPWYSTPAVAPGETEGKRPVDNVMWYDAVEFCNKLSEQEGRTPYYTINKTYNSDPDNHAVIDWRSWMVTRNTAANGYRLPTEAEWEYAARGGSQSQGYLYSGSDTIGDVAWISGNAGFRTHEVGKKAANELGLYDMSGNVKEWCWDWYKGTYYNDPKATDKDPVGATAGDGRVVRGGSWNGPENLAYSAFRGDESPYYDAETVGFRLARSR